MFIGGISFNGLGSLILCEGSVNEFSYAQALLIYKEEYDKLKSNKKLYFEQDGARCHTSKNNLNLIKDLLKKILFKIPQIPRFSKSNRECMGNNKTKY